MREVSSSSRSCSACTWATAWLTERWGLGAWSSFPTVTGQEGTTEVMFNPAIRYQRQRGRALHLAGGPGYFDSNAGTVAAAEWVFIPYADILYGIAHSSGRERTSHDGD